MEDFFHGQLGVGVRGVGGTRHTSDSRSQLKISVCLTPWNVMKYRIFDFIRGTQYRASPRNLSVRQTLLQTAFVIRG